jgi:hypothetical protein
MSLHSSISCPVRYEYITKWNEKIGIEVRHPLSMEKELGSQRYLSRYKADRWVRRILKYSNCMIGPTLRIKSLFRARTNRGLEDRCSVWGQLSPDSSRRIHSQVHELLQPTLELLAIQWKWFLQENSALNNFQGDGCQIGWMKLRKSRKSSFLDTFSKFSNTTGSCNSTE